MRSFVYLLFLYTLLFGYYFPKYLFSFLLFIRYSLVLLCFRLALLNGLIYRDPQIGNDLIRIMHKYVPALGDYLRQMFPVENQPLMEENIPNKREMERFYMLLEHLKGSIYNMCSHPEFHRKVWWSNVFFSITVMVSLSRSIYFLRSVLFPYLPMIGFGVKTIRAMFSWWLLSGSVTFDFRDLDPRGGIERLEADAHTVAEQSAAATSRETEEKKERNPEESKDQRTSVHRDSHRSSALQHPFMEQKDGPISHGPRQVTISRLEMPNLETLTCGNVNPVMREIQPEEVYLNKPDTMEALDHDDLEPTLNVSKALIPWDSLAKHSCMLSYYYIILYIHSYFYT